MMWQFTLITSGSSPLARGLQRSVLWRTAQYGIIPARAGFTPYGTGRRHSAADHPRSRGVYTVWNWEATFGRGSSPLARGLLKENSVGGCRARIIPARAGFTLTIYELSGPNEDHPRSRGVYDHSPCGRPFTPGSSPLARGLRVSHAVTASSGGIIPARAGFTVR